MGLIVIRFYAHQSTVQAASILVPAFREAIRPAVLKFWRFVTSKQTEVRIFQELSHRLRDENNLTHLGHAHRRNGSDSEQSCSERSINWLGEIQFMEDTCILDENIQIRVAELRSNLNPRLVMMFVQRHTFSASFRIDSSLSQSSSTIWSLGSWWPGDPVNGHFQSRRSWATCRRGSLIRRRESEPLLFRPLS